MPSLYIVDKVDEAPKREIKNVEENRLLSTCKSKVVIYRINGLWPQMKEMDQWIHTHWSTNYDYYLCPEGLVIV